MNIKDFSHRKLLRNGYSIYNKKHGVWYNLKHVLALFPDFDLRNTLLVEDESKERYKESETGLPESVYKKLDTFLEKPLYKEEGVNTNEGSEKLPDKDTLKESISDCKDFRGSFKIDRGKISTSFENRINKLNK